MALNFVTCNFLICFRKRGYPERGVPSKERQGGSKPGQNYEMRTTVILNYVKKSSY